MDLGCNGVVVHCVEFCLSCPYVLVVMFSSVVLVRDVDELMHFCTDSEDVERE